jgi:hypothetical protein
MVTLRPAQRQHRCRWRGRDTIARRGGEVYCPGCVCESATRPSNTWGIEARPGGAEDTGIQDAMAYPLDSPPRFWTVSRTLAIGEKTLRHDEMQVVLGGIWGLDSYVDGPLLAR